MEREKREQKFAKALQIKMLKPGLACARRTIYTHNRGKGKQNSVFLSLKAHTHTYDTQTDFTALSHTLSYPMRQREHVGGGKEMYIYQRLFFKDWQITGNISSSSPLFIKRMWELEWKAAIWLAVVVDWNQSGIIIIPQCWKALEKKRLVYCRVFANLLVNGQPESFGLRLPLKIHNLGLLPCLTCPRFPGDSCGQGVLCLQVVYQ